MYESETRGGNQAPKMDCDKITDFEPQDGKGLRFAGVVAILVFLW